MKEEIKSGHKGRKYWMKTSCGGYVGASKHLEEMTVQNLKKYKKEEAQRIADRAVDSWLKSEHDGKLIDYIIKEKLKESNDTKSTK